MMIKQFKIFEIFNELDPYGEEDWDDKELLTYETTINIGDIIYWNDGIELGTVTKIEKKENGEDGWWHSREGYDDGIWIYISQETVDAGITNKICDAEFGRGNLINSKFKIKHV